MGRISDRVSGRLGESGSLLLMRAKAMYMKLVLSRAC